jgi:hypothetical protein
MKQFIVIILLAIMSIGFTNCTSNQRAKKWGGTKTINLPKGMKLMTPTWKDDDLWYSYRPMRVNEQPEQTILKEDSSWGVMTGTVIFNETK